MDGFEQLAQQQDAQTKAGVDASAWDRLAEMQDPNNTPPPVMGTTTLLTAMARTDDTKDLSTQMTQGAITDAQQLLQTNQERTLRAQLAQKQLDQKLGGLNKLMQDVAPQVDPKLVTGAQQAYQTLLTSNRAAQERKAIEEEAVSKIHAMAAGGDATQAKVLLDNLTNGNAEQTISDFNVKMATLHQRAEELDDEYKQSGWGRWALNGVLGLLPLNYSFARSGIVDDGHAIADFFNPGSGLRRQGEASWAHPVDEFTADWAKDGPLMQSLRGNSTSVIGTFDPGAASEIMDAMIGQTDHDETWNNIWGHVDVASAVPISRIFGATRLLAGAGDVKSAVRNLTIAADTLDKAGPEAMTAATGVSEAELAAETSVKAVSGKAGPVPLSEQADTFKQAADSAIKELLNPLTQERFNSPEELQAAFKSKVDDYTTILGRPVKDVDFGSETLSTGHQFHTMEFTVGKKDGHGFATQGAATNGLKGMGISGDDVNIFRDQTGQFFIRVKKNLPEAGFYTNELHPPTEGWISRNLLGKVRSSDKTSDELLTGRGLEAGSVINRAQKMVQGNLMGEFGKLPKDSRDFLRAVSVVGGRKNKFFDENELHVLAERQLGRRATDAEIQANAHFRLFNDMHHKLLNDQLFLSKQLEGKETVKFTTPWGEDVSFDTKVDHGMSIPPKERVYDASTNTHYVHGRNPINAAKLATMKNNGYVMLELSDGGLVAPDGVRVNKVLIKKHDVEISNLKREQLAYKEGGHTMYATNKGQVFIKQGRTGVQPDTGSKYLSAPGTFRMAKNKAEGQKWADVMNDAREAVKKNPGITALELDDNIFLNNKLAGEGKSLPFPTGQEFLDSIENKAVNLEHPFEAVYDRELPSLYNQTSNFNVEKLFGEDELGLNGYYNTTGKMYTSARGDTLLDTNGEIAETLDPYETLNTSLQQVTRQNGLFSYKQEALERFKNTYGKYFGKDSEMSPYQMLAEGRIDRGVPRELQQSIENQRRAIQNVLKFQTPGERASQQLYQSVAEKFLGDGDSLAKQLAHDAVYWWKSNNPVQVLRGFAFDMKLGMFNPSQLLVQTSTMWSAFALSPKYGAHGMAGLFPMHLYLLKKGSENVLDTMAKRGIGKLMGFKTVEEFKDYARHAYKYGFMDMNGSHIMINSYGPSAHFGTFAQGANRFREAGRVPFYAAETWNRLVAYRIAWGETLDKGIATNSPTFNSTLLKRANDYSMSMTSESAAYWQKGLLSIPTQFWAYNVRMLDAMLGKGTFTRAQRARLIGMNFLVAGAAGIPGLDALSSYINDSTGKPPNIGSDDTKEQLHAMMDRGVIDYINYNLTGADVRIGERIGSGGWATQTVNSIFNNGKYGQTSMADLIGGSTYTISKQTSKTIWDLAKYAVTESSNDPGDLTGDYVKKMLNNVSTISNYNKAMMIHQAGLLMTSSGGVTATDLPPVDAYYQMLSFGANKPDEISHLMAYDKHYNENVKEVATQLRNWRQEAIANPDKMVENSKKAQAFLMLYPRDIAQKALGQANATMDKSFYDHLEQKVSDEQTAQQGNEQ